MQCNRSMETHVRFVRHSKEDTPRSHAKDAIVQMILSRGYRAGDKLPAYRALAGHLEVAPCTLVRALHELAEEGTLQLMHGKGVFVKRMPAGNGRLTTVGLVSAVSQRQLLRIGYLNQILSGAMTQCGNHQIDMQIVAFRRLDQLDRQTVVPVVSPRDLAMRADGLLLVEIFNDRYIAECAREAIPLVLVDGQTQVAPVSCVAVDNSHAVNLVMDHLYELGHRRIAYIDRRSRDELARGSEPAWVDTSDSRERREAYQAALQRLGLRYEWVYPPVEDTVLQHVSQVTGALRQDEQMPSAILCYDSPIACMLHQLLLDSGLRLPRDLSIAAAVGTKGGNVAGNQIITCIEVDFEEIGGRAITALLRQTKRQSKAAPQVERVSGELCVGTTTAKPRGR